MNSEFAPIGLSTYSRLEHLKKTVEALERNTLARQSELYVFSDAPKPGDEESVVKVRNFIKDIDGFKKTTIIERGTSDRIFNNRDGIRLLLEKYGKLIFLEEDIVTAPGFLRFVNAGLNVYETRKDIFAICGYTPPVQLEKFYKKDLYLSPRFSAWGFGIWANRYEKIIFEKINFDEFVKNSSQVRKFRRGGEDLLRMLKAEAEGSIDALDVKIFYTQFIRNLYTVSPTISLTNNIGHDGTGVHCGITDRFEVDLSGCSLKLRIDPDIQKDRRVIKSLYRFRSVGHLGLARKTLNMAKQLIKSLVRKSYRKFQALFPRILG
jgi:hypothetical protein